jgi:lysophospholipase L1-like esterase
LRIITAASTPSRARTLAALAVAWLILAGSACGGGGGGSSDSTAAQPVAPGTWAVLGSSTAAGVGGQGWVARLGAAQRAAGVTINNLARSGLLTSQALPTGTAVAPGRLPPDPTVNIDRALLPAPKLVILAFPTNDAMAGIPAAETVGHWQVIRQRATRVGAATLVLSTQPRDAADVTQRATLAETDRLAATAFGSCFVALRSALSDAQGNIAAALSAGDGIHLNTEGHRVVFEHVSAALSSGACVRLAY